MPKKKKKKVKIELQKNTWLLSVWEEGGGGVGVNGRDEGGRETIGKIYGNGTLWMS